MRKDLVDHNGIIYSKQIHTYYIGIGEYMVTNNPVNVLKICGLGSCVAVFMYVFEKKIGGLIHLAMPDSKMDSSKAGKMPGYYVDTGLPLFIESMKRNGATKGNVWIKLAGGANTLNTSDEYDIGKRNILAVKRYLWKYAMGPVNEDIKGAMYRTVTLFNDTGRIIISSGKKTYEL